MFKTDSSGKYKVIRFKGRNLNSKYNPLRDYGEQIKKLTSEKYYVVIGGSSGWFLKYLNDNNFNYVCFEIYEDLKKLLFNIHGPLNIKILSNNEIEDYFNRLFEKIKPADINLIIDAPQIKLMPEYLDLVNFTKDIFEINITSGLTVSAFKEKFEENFHCNLDLIKNDGSIYPLKNKFSGKDITVVCSGASLDKHMNFIKDDSIVIACDSALNALLLNNKKVHYTVTADPQNEVEKFFRREFYDSVLIYEISSYPRALKKFKDRYHYSAYNELNAKYSLNSYEMKPGGSVSSIAVQLAAFMGARRIYMIGQDLSIVNGLFYSKGTAVAEDFYGSLNKFRSYFDAHKSFLYFKRIKEAAGKKTVQNLSVYKKWFETQLPLKNILIVGDDSILNYSRAVNREI